MSNSILISFAGSHDLKQNTDGPLERLIKYLKPNNVYVFLTKEYKASYYENNLYEYYKNMFDGEIEFIETEIENPTDFEEIDKNISEKIEEINEIVIQNKRQSFLNLTSGTPAIIAVLSFYAITGQLNRAVGMYAPNTKFDKEIRSNGLNFYKDSVAYKTVKSLINSMDYIGLSEFLNIKNTFPRLQADDEFKKLVEFGRNRLVFNFEEAQRLYCESEILKQQTEYKKPDNMYEKAIECYMSAKVAERNKDEFQAIIKLAIMMEHILFYLLYEADNAVVKDLIEVKSNASGNKLPYLKEEVLNNNYPELKEYLKTELKSNIDCSRDITARLGSLILGYMIERNDNPILDEIKNDLQRLEEVKGARNTIAHNVSVRNYNIRWGKSAESLLCHVSAFIGEQKPDVNSYQELNNIILERLKQILNK